MTAGGWPCEAYGPVGMEVGAWCWLSAELRERVCHTVDDCGRTMEEERRRVFRRINERAAAGDPVAELLAREFSDPRKLLGGLLGDPG